MIELPESLLKVHSYMRKYGTKAHGHTMALGPNSIVFVGDRESISAETGYGIGSVTNALVVLTNLDVIQQVKKASKYGPSIWWLKKKEIPVDDYRDYAERNTVGASMTNPTKWNRMQDSLNRISNKLLEIESRVERLERDAKNNEIPSPDQ